MQDRFKFRVWLKDTNKMYNVHSLHIGTNKVIISSRHGNVSIYINKNSILIQSTGLKDKNGKLAYEGDVVELRHLTGKNCDKHNKFVITADTIGTGFQLSPLNPNEYGYRHIHRLQYDYTIIGNKYENPELLED